MIGEYRVQVLSKKLNYDFTIRRNITIIQGDSGTGKSTLVKLLEASGDGESGIQVNCKVSCTVVSGNLWKVGIPTISNSIIFIDESEAFVRTKEFASIIKKTDNYYVLITRGNLETLPYSIDEIYEIKNTGKFNFLRPTYKIENKPMRIDYIITEDSNSGYQFFTNLMKTDKERCISANGNSNITKFLKGLGLENKNILVVIDGAAFGAYIRNLVEFMKNSNYSDGNTYYLLSPECFEYMILKSDMFKNETPLRDILSYPQNYIESKEYFSWEIFFTKLLEDVTVNTQAWYSKRKLNTCYEVDCCSENTKCNFYIRGDKIRLILNHDDIKIDHMHLDSSTSNIPLEKASVFTD